MNGWEGQFRRGRQLELQFVDFGATEKIKISSVSVCHGYRFWHILRRQD